MKEKFFIRQGDILFEKVSQLETKSEPVGTKTVALGEVTNHHHSFTKNKQQVLLYKEPQEEMPSQLSVLDTSGPPELTHQEHLSIQFPKGEYIIRREQSYNPFLKQIQRSAD